MNYFQALILSVIEGVTEFLPISSTGHLILASDILKITQTEFVKSFEIIIQLGAILAVVFLYRKTLVEKIVIWRKILIAFLPTAVIGFIFYKLIKQYLLGNTIVTLAALFVGGIIIILLEKAYKIKNNRLDDINQLSDKKSFGVGLIQSISMIPGVSRAAATIFGGMSLGMDRKAAVEFSFLLAIPTMLAATGLDLLKSNFNFTLHQYFLLAIGFFGAFVVAYFTVKHFLRYIQNHNFILFGIYRIILAILFWFFIVR